MARQAVITVNLPREEVERIWRSSADRRANISDDAPVTFTEAPMDYGTEVHVTIEAGSRAGKLGEMARKVTGSEPLAKAQDDLRHFKQIAETGEIAHSDSTPQGEQLESKLKQRPAQPLEDQELEEVGV
jgi:uncharacterized membrane protein